MAAPLDLGIVRAVLCDLDGTLLDSTAATERVYAGWMRDRGLEPPAEHPHGVPARGVVARLAPDLDPEVEAGELARREIADTGGVVALPGAAELLSPRAPWGLEIAIVTSCTAPLAEARLAAAGLSAPSVVVTAERTEHGKPDPGPYLLAAELLGIDPGACLVLEDSPAGVAAGRAAGMQVVGVRTGAGGEGLLAADAALLVDDGAALAAMLPVRACLAGVLQARDPRASP